MSRHDGDDDTAIIANPHRGDIPWFKEPTMTVTCTSEKKTKPRTPNPSMPTDLDGLTEMLPTLGSLVVGGGIGVIEALSDAGRLPVWRELGDHWKGMVYGGLGGVCGYLVGDRKAQRRKARGPEAESIEAEVEALIEARGACYALGVIKLVKAGAAKLDFLKPACEAGKTRQPDGACAGLGDIDMLIRDDVRPALDELLANRALIEQASQSMGGFNMREVRFSRA